MIVRRVIVSVPDAAPSFRTPPLALLSREASMQAASISPAALRRTRLDRNGPQNVMAWMLEASTAGGPLPDAKVLEDCVSWATLCARAMATSHSAAGAKSRLMPGYWGKPRRLEG